jgi:hypothetical protein
MGRLTLNVLLSFAQFEREVTGERIRDKIAASKAKGMWMGGTPPLGYDPPTSLVSRALVINVAEAETVRLIFRRYLELANLFKLQQCLQDEGVRSKQWTSTRHRHIGGHAFSRGALQHLLGNRIYRGDIVHKGIVHRGRHTAILDEEVFAAVQAQLAHNQRKRRERVPMAALALLHGLVFDADGQLMKAVVARGQRKRRYHYYASPPTWPPSSDPQRDAIRRTPAADIENLVRRRLAPIAGMPESDLDREIVRSLVARVTIDATAVYLVLRVRALNAQSGRRTTVEVVRRYLLPGEQVTKEPHDSRLIRILLPVRLKLRGGRNWIIGPDGEAASAAPPPNRGMIHRIREAHAVLRACGCHPDAPNTQLRYAHAPKSARQMTMVRWAFLAPDIQRDILEGRTVSVAGALPKADAKIPLSWSEQRQLFANQQQNRGLSRVSAEPP